MNMIKAVVIDDESSNRRLIIKLISTLSSDFEIVGEAGDIADAYQLITLTQPDVVLLDIKMPGGSGFDLLKMFEKINFEVVFISGFDSYALKAFEFNALDYVLKPINPVKLAKTLTKIQTNIIKKEARPEELKNVLNSYDSKKLIISKISLHTGNTVSLVNIYDIIYIKSEDRCTVFKTNKNEKFISSKELSDFEFILDNHPYMLRANKSFYININYVLSYSKGAICTVTMSDETELEIPRRKKGELLNLLMRN